MLSVRAKMDDLTKKLGQAQLQLTTDNMADAFQAVAAAAAAVRHWEGQADNARKLDEAARLIRQVLESWGWDDSELA